MATTRSGAVELRRNGSAHLADHAASAALYVTDPMRKRARSETVPQGPQSGGASLSAGLTLANASAAASLAHANQKTSSPWRPAERQLYAEKAAAFVRSYQSPEPAPPTKANPDVYKAALAAAQERVYNTSPPVAPTTTEPRYEQAAYEHAMSAGRRESRETSPTVKFHPGAFAAATGAVSVRRRTESAPTKPMFHPDAAYALTAATLSHRASQDVQNVLSDIDPSLEASRIHHIAKTNAQLYTSTPPVEIEVEEQKHKDTLRAAAISMAKDMYATSAAAATSRGEVDGPDFASAAAQNRLSHRYSQSQFSWAPGDEYNATQQRTPNLHEAAQKIANEKLAKMQKNELQNQQQYYGTSTKPKSRQMLTRRLRRRTSSESDASQFDLEKSEQIRNQMFSLQSRLQQIDEKKTKDRADLMDIARKNVNARIHDMDEQVYAHTGKPSPKMQREWEEQAMERVRQDNEVRSDNFRRVTVGSQKYMDQTEVEAIARSRIQPTLDEIDHRVEEQRAREIEEKLDQEREQRQKQLQREREADLKAEEKQEKQQKYETGKVQNISFIRRHSTKGRGNVFSRTPKILLRRKTSEGEEKKVGEVKNQERYDEGATSIPTSPTENVGPTEVATGRIATGGNIVSTEGRSEGTSSQAADTTTQPLHGLGLSQPAEAQGPTETNVQNSVKSGSKLGSWFKGKLNRRFSKPPAPEIKSEKNNSQAVTAIAPVEGNTASAAASPRAAPLASNPVTATDFIPATVSSQQEEETPTNEVVMRQWSSSTEHSSIRNRKWSPSPSSPSSPTEQDGTRKRRLRMSLRDMITRKSSSEQGSTIATSPLASPAITSSSANKALGTSASAANSAAAPTSSARPTPAPRMNTMERNELRDSFAEESLSPPPVLFAGSSRRSVSSSARDSKFSEDI